MFVGESHYDNRTCSWPLLLLIYEKRSMYTPVRLQGWSNSAGGDRDFCRQASEWRTLILQLCLLNRGSEIYEGNKVIDREEHTMDGK